MTLAAAFAALVPLPVVIDEPGLYKTRCGEIVTVTRTSKANDFGNSGRYPNGVVDRWHRSGRLYFGMLSDNDIVSRL